jgi:hypothetical protein
MNDKPIEFQLLLTPPGYAWWISAETDEMLGIRADHRLGHRQVTRDGVGSLLAPM